MTGPKIKGRTSGIPFRQQRQPQPLLSLHVVGAELAAEHVAERVESISLHRSCCAYVFVRDGLVYVVSEESSTAHRWAVERTAEWVGCYGGLVDVARMAEELADFLR
ncbi:hypothetical protein EAH88_11805 [Rhodanobacter glycinis]|uniref:Uncharacterized protein n=1 Tax=Rhodanobacter glycinis TaxID=582702 RepID=A0A502C979_9GAMM|nr:hypothetical protein [Rhodanobacter glycinis]TPG08311.1 hypothetical protein EAH88_11805 [Rhodanobacter glycinis]